MSAIDVFRADIQPVYSTVDPAILHRKSRDASTVSPLLRKSLAGMIADVVVAPKTKDEIVRVVGAAVRHRLSITVRGGGTANYGQSVPIHGGIVLDMTEFTGVIGRREGTVRANAGALMLDIDETLRRDGWEMRIHPSTTATSTIAGFIAGGSGGIGSAMWGMLRDRGNIAAVELMSIEEHPRLIELSGKDLALVHHAWGTNAIITEVEMPVAPAWSWRECLVALPDFASCAAFGVRLVREPGVVKKLVSLQEWPIPRLMRDLRDIVPEGHSAANCYVAPACFADFADLVAEFGGRVVANHASGENPFGAPLYEFAYGHGLRQLQKTNGGFTGLQGLFPADNVAGSIEAVRRLAAGPLRLEVFLSQGEVVAMGSPVIVYESAAQMASLVDRMQAAGVSIANSHTTGVREVGIKQIMPEDAIFKREMDPHDLLNPGKLDFNLAVRNNLPTRGWTFRRTA